MCAYIWRILTSVRAPFYDIDLYTIPWIGEAINIRPRLSTPVPHRMVRSIVAGAFSDTAPVTCLTVGEIISDAPLSKLVVHIRKLTESCNEQYFDGLIDLIGHIRDKRVLAHRTESYPPLSIVISDHRSADISSLILVSRNPSHTVFYGETLIQQGRW